MLPVLRPEVRRHDVSLRLDLAPHLRPVNGDRVQLQQVLINLVMNGMEAMTPSSDRPREMVIRSRPDDSGVLVAVEDAGVGLDETSMARLFDAFFTTKRGGMGMGLSISRSIIEAHGGRLWATTNTTHGATFHFTSRRWAESSTPSSSLAARFCAQRLDPLLRDQRNHRETSERISPPAAQPRIEPETHEQNRRQKRAERGLACFGF